MRMRRRSKEETLAKRAAAFQRGWTDSLSAYQAVSEQPLEDKYDYLSGWWACADARRLETKRPSAD